jgi:outer membrane protein assembly factor BamB
MMPDSEVDNSKEWLTPRGDLSNTASVPDDVTPDPTSLSLDWRYETNNKRMFVPLVKGNVVIASTKSPEGDVFGLDAKDGTNAWTSEDDSLLRSEPAFVSDSLFGLRGDSLTGDTEVIHGNLQSPSIEIGNGMIIRAVGGELIIGHAVSGVEEVEIIGVEPGANQAEWRYDLFTEGEIIDIAIQDDIMYVSGTDYIESGDVLEGTGFISAFDLDKNEVLWEQTDSSEIKGLAVDETSIYVTGPGTMALDKASGDVNWRRDIARFGTCYPAIGSDHLYTADEHHIVALNKSSGDTNWKENMAGMSIRPSVGGETVFAVATRRGDDSSRLVALDTQTGERLFETRFGQTAVTAPAIANNAVYLGVDNGTVHKYA